MGCGMSMGSPAPRVNVGADANQVHPLYLGERTSKSVFLGSEDCVAFAKLDDRKSAAWHNDLI